MTPDQYCQEKAASSGSSFYYSFLFLDEKQRRAITAVYAFCREVDDIVDECSNEDVARAKLAWWHDTMQQTFRGNPQHPVQHALIEHIKEFELPLEWFEEIINGMQMDLNQTRYQRFDDLKLYCFRVAGAVGLLAAKIFGYTDERVVQYAETLGLAFQLTNIIRDIREDADRGRIYLPLEDLQEFDVTENEILSHQHNTKIKKLLTKQVQRTQSIYDQAFTFLPEGERYTQRCGIIMSALYRKILFVIEKDIESVLDKRVSLSPLNKLWIAWKTARDEKKRHKKSLLTCDA